VPLAGQQGAAQENFQQFAQQAAEAQRQGQWEQAIRLYLKALRLRPQWPEGWQNVGTLLADRKEYARAEAAFRNLVDIEPKNANGWALLGLAEYEQGHDDDAFAHIQHGRALGMTNADLYNVATFNAAVYQFVGFAGGTDATASGGMFYSPPWALFGTNLAGTAVKTRASLVAMIMCRGDTLRNASSGCGPKTRARMNPRSPVSSSNRHPDAPLSIRA
jgi:tetratricopeptide (TPR) repeat protein